MVQQGGYVSDILLNKLSLPTKAPPPSVTYTSFQHFQYDRPVSFDFIVRIFFYGLECFDVFVSVWSKFLVNSCIGNMFNGKKKSSTFTKFNNKLTETLAHHQVIRARWEECAPEPFR